MPPGDTDITESINDLDSAWNLASEPEQSTEGVDDVEEASNEVEGTDESDESASEIDAEVAEDDEGPDPESDEDDTFVIKVAGEEQTVTLEELVKGYQRSGDYTQKTQALAQERAELAAYKTLADAIQSDPVSTIRTLAERFGVPIGSEVDETLNGHPLDPDDPVEGELLRLRKQTAELERRNAQADQQRQALDEDQRKAAVLSEIDGIKDRYNDPDLDPSALLQFAVENEVGNLDIAYQAMVARKPEPPVVKRLKAKRAAPPVEGGAHRSGVKSGSPSQRMSLEEALAEALSSS